MAIESSIRDVSRAFGRMPDALKKELRPQLRAAGESIRSDMRNRASWSSRIPAAIGMTVSFSPKGGGIRFRVNAKRAPHARPYEGVGNRGGTFRHPVFGDRDVWVSQATRPYFFPALKAGREDVKKHITAAVQASLRGASR